MPRVARWRERPGSSRRSPAGSARPALHPAAAAAARVASARASSSRLRPATVRSPRACRAGARGRHRCATLSASASACARLAQVEMRADGDVLAHRLGGEGLHDLEGARHAARAVQVRRAAGDVAAVEDAPCPCRGSQEPRHQREQRRLAGAVGPDQRAQRCRAALRGSRPRTAFSPPKAIETPSAQQGSAMRALAAERADCRPMPASLAAGTSRSAPAPRRRSTMFSPGSSPNRLRVRSPSTCSTAAPSSGPHSVPMPPTIGRHQRLDRDRRAVGDARVDVLEHLHVERAARAHERARQHDRAELHAERDRRRARAPRPRCRAPPAATRRSASAAATT